MNVKFIPVKSKANVSLPKSLVDKLPGRVILFTTIQFVSQLDKIKDVLEKNSIEVILIKPRHSSTKGHLLGCSIEKINKDFDAFLYIGDGLFHPKALVLKNEKPVFAYDPFSKKQFFISEEDVQLLKKRRKGALLKFHVSRNIGVLITTKSGQSRFDEAFKLETLFPEKKFFYFLLNTLDPSELENFPFIDLYVNTMCPRIAYDDSGKFEKKVLNIEDLGISW